MPLHLAQPPEGLAPIAILPGDPERVELIAREFLDSPRSYSRIRGLLGYTGKWKGCPLTVQASGTIICEELAMLGVRTIIRIGTCGTLQTEVETGSLIIANTACSCDGASSQLALLSGYAPTASWKITTALAKAAEESGAVYRVGSVASMDLFYDPRQTVIMCLRNLGVLALEMEAAAVFTVAALRGMSAGAIFAVTDTVEGQRRAEQAVIERTIRSMISVTLECAVEAGERC